MAKYTTHDQNTRFKELQRKAEDIFSRTSATAEPEKLQDVRQLIHKLNVYQIELELQNEELMAAQRDLEISRDKYVKLYDFAPICYFTFSKDGIILEANLTGSKLLGVDRNYLLNKPFMTYIAPDSQDTFYKHRNAAFEHRIPQMHEMAIRSRSGAIHHVQMHSIVITGDAPDAPPMCLSAVVDISERVHVEEKLTNAMHRADAANRAKSEFLARMSHEIRTPLHGIMGMTEVLKDSDLDSEQRNQLAMVTSSATDLLHIVNDILDISRIEIGRLDLELENFDLRLLMADAVAVPKMLAARKNLAFTLRIGDGAPECFYGDPFRLKQIVLNLAGNAVKFTQRGSVTVSVEVNLSQSASAPDTPLLFTVTDTGVGIPQQHLDKIFERFYQVDNSYSRDYDGAGLGLTIAKHLVDLMGGAMGVNSELDKGTSFYFTVTLPRVDALECEPPHLSPDQRNQAQETPAAAKNLKILLAEDNLVNQTFAKLILGKAGHTVHTAASGAEVLEMLRTEKYDIILMDVRMPGMDGVEATKRIRNAKDLPNPHIPIIAMTAHSLKGDRERFLEAGMDDYVSKPVDWDHIHEVIHRACG